MCVDGEISRGPGIITNYLIPQSEALGLPGNPKLACCRGYGKISCLYQEAAAAPEVEPKGLCVVSMYLR